MARKYFGTDGVRGRANQYPMTAEIALRIGAAAGQYFRNDDHKVHRVVIGLSLIHISEPTRQAEISYAVFCLK